MPPRLPARLLLWLGGLLAFALTGFSNLGLAFERAGLHGSIPTWAWLRPLLFGVVAGVALAFAIRSWPRDPAVRWKVVFWLGLLPLLGIVLELWAVFDRSQLFEPALPGHFALLAFRFFPLPVPAVLLGMAIVGGIGEREADDA